MKMKKILAMLLGTLLLAASLTGCGNKADVNSDSSNDQSSSGEHIREIAKVSYHEAAESFAGGNGTKEDPFQISEAGHLVLLHEMLEKEEAETNFDETYVKGYFILTDDISLNDTSDFANWSTDSPEYGWEPIGTGVSSNSFAGILDGNGHKISGMFIETDSGDEQSYYGLFAEMGGMVKNLTVEKSYICVFGGTATVGTIAGSLNYSDEAVIENCKVNSEIKLYDYCEAGGIAGNISDGSVSDCSYSGTIIQADSADSFIGGICGTSGSIQGSVNGITNCSFSGTLSCEGTCGGIVGSGDNVAASVNKGNITGERAGGILGTLVTAGTDLEIKNTQLLVESCVNEGTVNGMSLAGGIIAQTTLSEVDIAASIVDCENKGQVVCDEAVAGIIGCLSVERSGNICIDNCVNNADVSGKGKTGGIICELVGGALHQEGNVTVLGCKNMGDIVSEGQYSAGIITYLIVTGDEVDLALVLEDCSNEGAVKSTQYAGGILGFSNVGFNAEVSAENINFSNSTKVILNKCNNTGSITITSSNSMAGGIVGVLGLGYIPTEINHCVNTGDVTIDFSLTDEQIAEAQGSDWAEYYQIGGGIVGRIGDALKLTTAEGVETSTDNVNAADGNIMLSGCNNRGKINAPDYSFILNKWKESLYVNYLGDIVGQYSTTDGYAFSIKN